MTDFVFKQPEEQSELFGHSEAERILLENYNKGTLDGSWLFCGPRGVGKATLAFRLARFLAAQSGQGGGLFGDPPPATSLFVAPTDPAFSAVATRSAGFMKVVERALKEDELKKRQDAIEKGEVLDPSAERARKRNAEITIADIRSAESFIRLTASSSTKRILIVDSADDMNLPAANAFLKTLEEPPANTVLILISHAPGRLLPTIRSRCRKLTLNPLDNAALEQYLGKVVPDLSVADRHALSLLAEGSAGKALTLAELDGLDIFRRLTGLFSGFPKVSVSALYETAEALSKDKSRFQLMTDLFVQWLSRACVLCQCFEGEELVAGEFDIVRRLCSVVGPLDLMDLTQSLSSAFRDTDLDAKQVFINAVTTLQRGGNA